MSMKHTRTITVRLSPTDYQRIQDLLKEFGCKSVSDFARFACTEKLERTSISGFVAEQIERIEDRQRKLDSATSALLKMQEINTQTAMETMQKTSENLAKIAAKIG